MFDTLSHNLTQAFNKLTGQSQLTEKNMADSLDEIRVALLDADVSLPVVKNFIETIRAKTVGQVVTPGVRPGQFLVKLVHDELVTLMGGLAGRMRREEP